MDATAFIFLLDNITVQGLAFFAPTIVATIYPAPPGVEDGTVDPHNYIVSLQLHTVPPYVVGAFFTVLLPLLSTYFDRRIYVMLASAPFMMIGYIMFLASMSPHVRYGATFLIAIGSYSFGALCNAQSAANVVSDNARSAAM